MTMEAIKSYTDIEQSSKLAEILPLESADMYWDLLSKDKYAKVNNIGHCLGRTCVYAWSLAALLDVLPEINGISPKIEKVKAEDGYDGYYYPIEYEGIVLIPYPKNPIDACYEMILKLHELNLL